MEENKKKVSSREAWRLHRRAAKLFYAERPALHAVNWLYAAFKSLSPYVLIWLSAQIIGELTGARDAHRLTVLAVAAVAAASLLPLITAVVAWRLLGERVSLRGWIGFALAVAGVVWLSLQSAVDETATAPVLGNFFEGLAMVCAALYTVLARRLSAAYSPLQITAVQSFVGMSFFAGLLALAPLDYTPVLLHVAVPDWAPWASVVYLGGVVSLGGYGLYNVGVSRLSAAGAAAYTNLIPILTLASGVILLREVFLPGQYMASVLVVAGVLLSQWGGQKGRREDS